MKRHWVFALAALVAVPRPASAQSDMGWGPRLRITPFVGISPGITQEGDAFTSQAGTITRHPYEMELNSGVALGVNAEYRVWNRFSIVGEGVWSTRGSGTLTDARDARVDTISGSNYWIAKVAAAMRLREHNPDMQLNQLDGSIFVGPAYIRDAPKVELNTPAGARAAITQIGLNVGADAELPLANNRLALQVGLEDFIIFWDEAAYAGRIGSVLQQRIPTIDAVGIDAGNTSLWIGRVGLTFRF